LAYTAAKLAAAEARAVKAEAEAQKHEALAASFKARCGSVMEELAAWASATTELAEACQDPRMLAALQACQS
jgi:hypothetical protein